MNIQADKTDATQLALDRTWLAHERTLMAWIRTSVSMISFGFTIYKFFQFEQGRNALENGALEEEQSRVRLIKSIRLPGGLPYDWSELLLTMAMLFALLLGLYVGLIGS